MSKRLLIFGYGYTGQALAKRLYDLNCDTEVIATSRGKESKPNIANTRIINFSKEELKPILNGVTHIVSTIPPNIPLGDVVISKFGNMITQDAQKLQWIGYISSTGVYGNYQGMLVNENSYVKPSSTREQIRFSAECEWLNFTAKLAVPGQIFRCAGIYGPYRNPLTRMLSKNDRTIYISDNLFSRIHVEDIANILIKMIYSQRPISGIYNLADDLAASTHSTCSYAIKLLKLDPKSVQYLTNAPPAMQAFYRNYKIVQNHKAKNILGFELSYPNYKIGFDAIFHNKLY